MFEQTCNTRAESCNEEMAKVNKLAKAHARENHAVKQQDPDQSNYDPELVAMVLKALVECEWLQLELQNILSAKDKNELDEFDTRDLVYGLSMFFDNDQRAVAIENMKYWDYKKMKPHNGVECMLVSDDKTGLGGPAAVSFPLPYLYSALGKYIELFRLVHLIYTC